MPISPNNKSILRKLALLMLVLMPFQLSAQEGSIEPQPAIQAPLADQSLMLDVIRHDDGFVAVGSRGHVLLSEDGLQWRQAGAVPVQATLTRVTQFGRRLWAVGHDATIISSTDAGETWFIQHFEPEAQEPLLDVLFLNPNEGFAIGAYGRFMTTSDGGINWESSRLTDRVTSEAIDWASLASAQGDIETMPDEFQDGEDVDPREDANLGCYEFGECHLNAIIQVDSDRLVIAAERGYGFRSTDEGETWEAFRFPYTGSMFGLLEQQDCLLAFGLRGHIQKSCDFGRNWDEIPVDSQQTLMGGKVAEDGTAVLVGAGATKLRLYPDGRIERDADQLGSDYAAVALADDGLVIVGEDGVTHE
ncbi:MAG: hypothetical protein CMP07_13200 [Xanthomonadales bacterium]|nr:hypothetical protein [Xanthomonadales bacterium]